MMTPQMVPFMAVALDRAKQAMRLSPTHRLRDHLNERGPQSAPTVDTIHCKVY